MTLGSFIFAGITVLVIIFGSLFFCEWVEKHTRSFAMETFSVSGMPVFLFCVMILLYELLHEKGIIG